MNVHKNARSFPASRALLIDRVERQGWSIGEAAGSIGLSVRRARDWIRRSRSGEPLTDRSSRPKRTRSLPTDVVQQVLALRRRRVTMSKIAELSGVSCSSVARICRKQGLSRLSMIDLHRPPVIRYERQRPGELLHVDTKKLGRFHEVGHRITKQRTFGKGGGWELMHVAIDDASRVTYAEILSDEKAAAAAGFLDRAVAWFRFHGVNVERVMTDNGPAYLSKDFAALCRALAIKHIRTRPYTPRTNGKVERVIQTLLREWAYQFAYPSSDERRRWLIPYLHFYNVHRRHSALGYTAPISRLDRNNLLTLDS